MNPYFSIIIPSYNRAKFIKKTLETVQNQTFTYCECILIDDGSEDDTYNVLEEIKRTDERIKYYYQENSERCIARNHGIEKAKGKYICFLDSDDFFLSIHLQTIYDEIKLKNEPQALLFTNAYSLETGDYFSELNCPELGSMNVQDYILHYTFNPARVAVCSSIVKDNLFDPKIPGLEDLELWLRISLKFPIFQIKERTVIYNVHDQTYTLGDLQRFKKELNYFNYIFEKAEFKGKLSSKSKNRLLSMCYYYLQLESFELGNKKDTIKRGLKSFLLYPKSYNGMTNKSLFTMIIYSIPFIGFVVKKLIRGLK
jgi:glycosyltransferase involved in cell wall biosynthesis